MRKHPLRRGKARHCTSLVFSVLEVPINRTLCQPISGKALLQGFLEGAPEEAIRCVILVRRLRGEVTSLDRWMRPCTWSFCVGFVGYMLAILWLGSTGYPTDTSDLVKTVIQRTNWQSLSQQHSLLLVASPSIKIRRNRAVCLVDE